MTSYMSYDCRVDSGRMSSIASSRRSTGSEHMMMGGFSSHDDGKNERYSLMTPMHSESSLTSTSPTPDFSLCHLVPPSSCSEMSCPVTALTSGGPPSAIEPMSFSIGTKSASPGMYAVPAAPGPTM